MDTIRRSLQVLALALGALGAYLYLRPFGADTPKADPADASQPVVVSIAGTETSGRRLVSRSSRSNRDPERGRIVLLNNEAAELLQVEDFERAVELFEECHEAYPEDLIFAGNLAEALSRLARRHYSERRFGLAIAELERVLTLAPDREDRVALGEVLDRWRKEAELAGEETTDTSRYFELTYNASREDVLHRSGEVIASLERSYGILRDWFQVDPVIEGGRAPIHVVLYAPRTFDHLTGLGDWAGGAFDGTVRISVADLEREADRWRRVARHELSHAFLREVGGIGVPGWLNEGIAQWLEGGVRSRRVSQAKTRLIDQSLFPLDKLQGSLARWEDTEEIARAYAQSLVLVAHIANNYGELVLLQMAQGCAEGRDPAETFEANVGVPLAFVLEDLPKYLR